MRQAKISRWWPLLAVAVLFTVEPVLRAASPVVNETVAIVDPYNPQVQAGVTNFGLKVDAGVDPTTGALRTELVGNGPPGIGPSSLSTPRTVLSTDSQVNLRDGAKVGIDYRFNGVVIPPTANPVNALTSSVTGSAASNLILCGKQCNLYDAYAVCTAACWLMVFNSTSKPNDGSTTAGAPNVVNAMVQCIDIAAGSHGGFSYSGVPPEPYTVGVTLVISSTSCGTLTAATTGFIRGRAM